MNMFVKAMKRWAKAHGTAKKLNETLGLFSIDVDTYPGVCEAVPTKSSGAPVVRIRMDRARKKIARSADYRWW